MLGAASLQPDISPDWVALSALAADLKHLLDHEADGAGRTDLLSRVLTYAAGAEQTIAEQKARIDYLEALSITDELTGLLNRRGFQEVLERTLSLARRHDEAGVLAYIDLNRFKDINDQYGHEAGDRVLSHTARILKNGVRTTDYAARLGGDEFTLLLVNANPIAARKRLRALAECLSTTPVVLGDGLNLTIAASFGISSYGASTCPDDLMRRADAAMYRTKRGQG